MKILFTHKRNYRLKNILRIALLLFIIFFVENNFGQSDTAAIVPDSLASAIDTAGSKGSDIDSVIYSTGKDSLVFYISKKKMDIYGGGFLRYKDTQLNSGKIYIDFETSNVEAFGVENDSGKLVETPTLSDKGEEYKGNRMKYNFKTTRGFITYAKTESEEASYSGARIKKIDQQTFFIENGIYSTCDLPEPHYFFYGKEMKVIQKEQLVGKWIWLAFANVPFPIPLPFAVVPMQSGRRSGLLAPAYGERANFGKYFSRFGYFWALSDYVDWNITSDYYTKGGYSLNSLFRYTERYNFSGYLEGGYSDLVSGERTDPGFSERKDWRIRWVHNQTITPTSRFDVNLEFLSGNFFQQNTTDYNQLLRNEIVSNATYYKSWEESGISLSASYRRNQEVESGNIAEELPTISFSKSQFYPFKRKNSVGEQSWYELIGFSYNSNAQNKRNKVAGDLKIRGGIQHSLRTGFSPKVGYFNVSPSISYNELWYNKQVEKYAVLSSAGGDSIITNDVKKISMVRTFDFGVSTSTKIYGVFQANNLGVQAIRHIIQPSISFSYAPDFSNDSWGYFSSYKNTIGETVKYNKYEREIYGGPQTGERRSLSFGLDNLFEMKTAVDPTDTTSKEKKIQLLNFSMSAGYNFAADSVRLSDLNVSYRTQVSDFLNFSGSSTYTFYSTNEQGSAINKFLINEGRGLLRLRNFNFSISTSLSGEKLKGESKGEGESDEEVFIPQEKRMYQGLYETEEPDFTIPWSVSLNYNFGLSKYNPAQISKYSSISTNLNFNMTRNWKFSITGSYDIENKQFSAPQVTVSRDLHCWIMNFTWNPIGTYTGYRFEIRVKASQLQDLKVTKTDRFFSGRR